MPSKNPQFNVRPDAQTAKLIEELLPLACQKTGLVVSQSGLLRLAMFALAEKWEHSLPVEGEPKPKKPKK